MKIGQASTRGIIYSVNEKWGVCRVVFVQIAPRKFRLFKVGNWLNRYTDEEYFRDQDVPDDFIEVGSIRQVALAGNRVSPTDIGWQPKKD